MRLDIFLVENGYFKSRSRAQDEIKSGHVFVNKKQAKASLDVSDTDFIEIVNAIPYVSRGGLKLEKAIKVFNLDFKNKIILDIGASTGGFTDCSLMHGAKKVYAVDVGQNQLDFKLRNDSRVINLEGTNILDTNIEDKIDYLVMDVSFVSIIHLVDAIKKYLNDDNLLVCLIKPEFEAGTMVKKGVIRDKKLHFDILSKVKSELLANNLYISKIDVSPIKGGSGNIEFISIIETKPSGVINIEEVVNKAYRKV